MYLMVCLIKYAGGNMANDQTLRLCRLLGTEFPIIQAPMAGVQGSALATAVSETGGMGSLPCAMQCFDAMRAELAEIRGKPPGLILI